MLPDLRESESNLCSHTINEHKLASYHNKVAIPEKKKWRGGETHAKAMYSSNNAGVVGNRVVLGTLKARKQNYSGAKWRSSSTC